MGGRARLWPIPPLELPGTPSGASETTVGECDLTVSPGPILTAFTPVRKENPSNSPIRNRVTSLDLCKDIWPQNLIASTVFAF